jgi:hypothetical protein
MKTNIRLWSYIDHFFLEWEAFLTKSAEKLKTHILCSITFFLIRAVYEIMLKNIVQPNKPQRRHSACALHAGYLSRHTHTHTHTHTLSLTHTHTHTHSQYVTQSGMLQRTVFINKISMLQRTQIYNERGGILSADVARASMTFRDFPLWLERQTSSLLSFVRFSYQFSSVICASSSVNTFLNYAAIQF